MTYGQLLNLFFSDKTLQLVGLYIAVDFTLGVAAALKTGTFKMGWLHGFLVDDVLAKVVPFGIVYMGAKTGLSDGWFEILRDSIFAVITASFVASILGSLAELGFASLPPALMATKTVTVPPEPQPTGTP